MTDDLDTYVNEREAREPGFKDTATEMGQAMAEDVSTALSYRGVGGRLRALVGRVKKAVKVLRGGY